MAPSPPQRRSPTREPRSALTRRALCDARSLMCVGAVTQDEKALTEATKEYEKANADYKALAAKAGEDAQAFQPPAPAEIKVAQQVRSRFSQRCATDGAHGAHVGAGACAG